MATRKINPAEHAQIRRPSKPRMRRADKLVATRAKLLAAATEIVGAEGYGSASIAKITARAHLAQGTFYNYFESQQDLFDQLLPDLGTQLLEHIRTRIAGSPDGLRREEIGFRAFFEFLADTPEFYRILNEAETFSPRAFGDHMSNMIESYTRALRRSQQRGALPGYDPKELEVIVCILLGARNYLVYHFMMRSGRAGAVPDWIVRAYMKFVAGGEMYGGTSGPTYRPRQAAKKRSDGTTASHSSRLVEGGANHAVLELRVQDSHRDATGAVCRPVLLDLLTSAADLAACGRRGQSVDLLNLSVSVLVPARADRLVATSHCERRRPDAVQVAVSIHEKRRGGTLVMTGQATFIDSSHNMSDQ
jgi:AcrR family transcriptional regulator/acyl-coenzyme A thioesterase PaaI-like protein